MKHMITQTIDEDNLVIKSPSSRVLLPFRYPGGKYYAISILSPFWEAIEHDEYREPMVGGGAIFFCKDKAQHNWVNDLDKDLIETYRIISNGTNRNKLLKRLKGEKASKERWRQILNFVPKTDLDMAYRYYYLNRTSFSGKLSSPGWGYRPKRSLPPERWGERISPCGERLEGVKITCLDFEDVITEKATGKKVLMYLDPPYFSPPKNKHYRNGFNKEDHLRLAKTLKNTKHKFFLTYDDVPEIRKMYSWANINEVNFFYRVDNSNVFNGKRRVGFELVITNYKMPSRSRL